MSKTKSVVMTVILTIVIVVLSLMCVVPEFTFPFRVGGIWKQYNSVVSVINYGSDLGGGYSAIYYPEGVLSAEDYNTKAEYYEDSLRTELQDYLGGSYANVSSLEELKSAYAAKNSDKDVEKALYDYNDFQGKYIAYTSDNFSDLDGAIKDPAIYLENNEACFKNESTGKYVVEDDFEDEVANAAKIIAKRFDKKNLSYLGVFLRDDFTIQVNVPYTVSNPDNLFEELGYTGDFTLRANADITTKYLLKATKEHPMSDYFKDTDSYAANDGGIVQFNLTSLGRETIYDLTNTLRSNDTDASLYFYVGENEVIGLGLSDLDDGLDKSSIAVSGELTADNAENISIVINSCLKYGGIDMDFSISDTIDYTVGSGEGSLTAIYVVFVAVMLAMMIFSVVRYKGMGLAHVYAYLSYLICMLMFVAFLSGMLLNVSGVFAVVLTSVLMVLTNFYIFENIKEEFATGKTLSSAIKAGYKKSLASVLDTHILLFIITFVMMFISVSEIVVFSYVFLLGVLMSGISTLLLTRYYSYILRGLVERNKQHNFYGLKREVVEDDEE